MTLSDILIATIGLAIMFVDGWLKSRHKTIQAYWYHVIHEDQKIIASALLLHIGACATSYMTIGYIDSWTLFGGYFLRDQISRAKKDYDDPLNLKGKK